MNIDAVWGSGYGPVTEDTGKVGVAVVGAGYWGPNHVRTFDSLPDCQLRWVCDQKPGRLQFIRERFPHVPLTDDYAAVLRDPAVEAVVIATPVSTHRDLALAALGAGKHVLAEKPLAGSAAQAEEIVRAGREAGRLVAVGHIFVFNPAVTRMKELIAGGQIGRLCYVESSRVNLGPPASEVNVVWDLAVHDVAILLHLWDQRPIEVTAYGSRYVHPTLVDVAFLHLRFADGGMAMHHVGWLSPEKVRRFVVAGTHGSLAFDDTRAADRLRLTDRGVDSRVGTRDDEASALYYRPGEVLVVDLPAVEPLRVECQHFLDCVRRGEAPRSDGEAGLRVVRVLEAADESIRRGSVPVRL
ncbi:MAG: Gfo/Idh/MocA family oxidoreductase [Chloroflexi bacterium]|nr:Gfo/Idh/MocA family oxidoreductase [Chloroflexota bacterium]